MKRMARASKQKKPTLNLVSLMDVFTILVFFLLVNSSSSDVMEQPKNVMLPESVVDSKPRETVIVLVTEDSILVQGDVVMSTAEVIESKDSVMLPIKDRLLRQQQKVIGFKTKAVAESKEVTVLAHRTLPFKLLKKVMASCTSAGYGKISLAVIQKASQTG
ncbi:MAG: biopolymer transporter ExbD [Gammaproteobacteria bacterium]|nr:biopolymer transporter ExbD [Gammaproteobacteria bacterium]